MSPARKGWDVSLNGQLSFTLLDLCPLYQLTAMLAYLWLHFSSSSSARSKISWPKGATFNWHYIYSLLGPLMFVPFLSTIQFCACLLLASAMHLAIAPEKAWFVHFVLCLRRPVPLQRCLSNLTKKLHPLRRVDEHSRCFEMWKMYCSEIIELFVFIRRSASQTWPRPLLERPFPRCTGRGAHGTAPSNQSITIKYPPGDAGRR